MGDTITNPKEREGQCKFYFHCCPMLASKGEQYCLRHKFLIEALGRDKALIEERGLICVVCLDVFDEPDDFDDAQLQRCPNCKRLSVCNQCRAQRVCCKEKGETKNKKRAKANA